MCALLSALRVRCVAVYAYKAKMEPKPGAAPEFPHYQCGVLLLNY